MTLSDVLLKVAPKNLQEVVLVKHNGGSIVDWGTGCTIESPNPTKTIDGYLIYLHECAHSHLNHHKRRELPTYYKEIEAWSQVLWWLKKYPTNVPIEHFKKLVTRKLKLIWKPK